jgi:glycosyltransferase involved in cell wall biosynthesis
VRLGVYADLVYRREGDVLSTDFAFVRFPVGLSAHVEELVLFGRLHPRPGSEPYPLPPGIRFVPLPHYPSVFHVGALLRSAARSVRTFSRELEHLDAVWLFGPAPLAVAFGFAARRAGVPVVLGVRQDYPRYIADRLPSRRWFWAVGAAWLLELAFRRLARTCRTVAVGEALAAAYRRGAPVLATGLSLVSAAEVADAAEAAARSWDGELRLLSVGRVEPEKNPLLLAEILAELRRGDPRWRLRVAGTGALVEQLRRRAVELGVADALEPLGYVANGPELQKLYRESQAFLHVSLTEGVPQVLFEAHAAGLPVVATDVGGVRAAVDGGRTALLVPPRDAVAAACALERLRDEPELRRALVAAGLERAREETLEAQLARVAEFVRAAVREG